MMRFYFFNFVLKVGIGRLMEARFINQIEKDLQRKIHLLQMAKCF